MAKKYKSTKMLKQTIAATQRSGSAFGQHANRLADAKKKKIQKLTDTQKRVLQSKKNNKMIKISKKAKKFALLDQQDQNGQGALGFGLTHKGVNVKDLKDYDDVNFNESDLENDEQFDNLQDKMQFAGFEATQNLLENQKPVNDNKPKTQNQIYKQIIQKSKAYKLFRQQQYEQNLQKATELDNGFDQLVSQLKFRNKDQQMLQRLQHRDLEYDKLMNQLKDDERIVSNKIVERNEKDTEKIRKKKNQQLNKLMKDSDSQNQDIRGWVDDAGSDEQEQNEQQNSDNNQDEQVENNQKDEQQGEQQQGSYDELDDVNLSSSQQQEQGEQNQEQDAEAEQQDSQDEENDGQNEQEQEQGSEQQDEQQEEDQQDQDSDEQQSQVVPPPQKNINNSKKAQQQSNNSKTGNNNASKGNPQKKVKLNFVQ